VRGGAPLIPFIRGAILQPDATDIVYHLAALGSRKLLVYESATRRRRMGQIATKVDALHFLVKFGLPKESIRQLYDADQAALFNPLSWAQMRVSFVANLKRAVRMPPSVVIWRCTSFLAFISHRVPITNCVGLRRADWSPR